MAGKNKIGKFIVLEGGDVAGKSTQSALLSRRLREKGISVVETFEPGGTSAGSEIRSILLGGQELCHSAEALLMAAARANNIELVIKPALLSGSWVICDRFLPSSLVYQGVGRGLGIEYIQTINKAAGTIRELAPDLIIVLDVELVNKTNRREADKDRFESAGTDFSIKVVKAYQELAKKFSWEIIDAAGTVEDVHNAIWNTITSLFRAESHYLDNPQTSLSKLGRYRR